MTSPSSKQEAQSRTNEYAAQPGLEEVLLEHLEDAVFVADPETREIRFWSRAATRLFGWSSEEALGHHVTKLLVLTWPAGSDFSTMMQTIRAEGFWRGVILMQTRDGHRPAIDTTVRPLEDAAGTVLGLVTICRQAVLSAKGEEAIRASEANFRSFFESATQPLYLVDPSWRVMAFNRAAATEQLKSQGHQIGVGDDARTLVNPTSRAQFEESFAQCLRGEAVRMERRIEFPSGQVAWFELAYTPVRTTEGEILGVAFSGLDVTAHKREAEALWLRERALEASNTGLVILDARLPGEPAIYVNPAFEALTGYPAAEQLGKSLSRLAGHETDPVERDRLRAALDAGQACEVLLTCYRKDGSSFWNRISLSPLRDEAGTLTHYVSMHTDDTARVQLEEQLRHAQKLEGIGRLAGGVAHDFNNLLTVILNSAELMGSMLSANPEALELRDEILFAGQRAAELTRQLLAFSRRQVLQPRVVELGSTLTSMGRMLARLIREDIALRITTDGEQGLVRVDPGQLEQVIMNLVVNARDAMPRGGVLRLETACVEVQDDDPLRHGAGAGPYVRLTVADDGLGMDELTREHIFEPFFTTKEVGKGTGMGLATVHGIVQQSGGFITVTTAPEQGSTFQVFLPRVHAKVEAPGVSALAAGGGDETILLVEDDDAVRRLASLILRGKGYLVIEAASATEALNTFATRHGDFELLLTDVVMPGLSGLELARRLASINPKLRVLFMSGYSYETLAERGPPALASAMLAKPFTPESLGAKVREVLDARREPAGA